MESDSLVSRTVPLLNLSLQVPSPRMDLYPFATGPSAKVLGFLRAAIVAMLIIVWLMIKLRALDLISPSLKVCGWVAGLAVWITLWPVSYTHLTLPTKA